MSFSIIFEGFLSKIIIFQQFGFFEAIDSSNNSQNNTRIETVTITRYTTKFRTGLETEAVTRIKKRTTSNS